MLLRYIPISLVGHHRGLVCDAAGVYRHAGTLLHYGASSQVASERRLWACHLLVIIASWSRIPDLQGRKTTRTGLNRCSKPHKEGSNRGPDGNQEGSKRYLGGVQEGSKRGPRGAQEGSKRGPRGVQRGSKTAARWVHDAASVYDYAGTL